MKLFLALVAVQALVNAVAVLAGGTPTPWASVFLTSLAVYWMFCPDDEEATRD